MDEKVNDYMNFEEEIPMDVRMRPETKNFMQMLLKITKPGDIPKMDINLIRQTRDKNAAKVIESLDMTNLDVNEIFIPNPNDNHSIPVTVFKPKDLKANAPVTIFFHGGGWSLGSRLTHFHTVHTLSSMSKTIWLSVEYRLGPEHKFTTQFSDVKCVLEWVTKNRTQLGTSENAKIGVSGDSAGGHYSALLTHEYKGLIDYQILIYPCVDMASDYDSAQEFKHDAYYLVPDLIKYFIDNLIEEPATFTNDHKISPILNEDFSKMPKALIIAAELDPLVDQSKFYHQKLLDNNNQSELKIINGTIHGFFHNGFALKEAFGEAVKYILEFIEKL